MRPVFVVVADELGQHRRQVLLVEHYQVVEALAAEGFNDAIAFARGDRTGVAIASIPMRRARWRKSRPWTASRSRSRCRGLRPQGVASMTRRQTQALVGLADMLTCTSSRRPCAINTMTYAS
jgi:hypothetical protein